MSEFNLETVAQAAAAPSVEEVFGNIVVPPQPTGTKLPSFDEWRQANAGEFAASMKDLMYGQHNVKFLGVNMVETKFGLTPEYHFDVNGKEHTLWSKSFALAKLRGREGQNVSLLKQRNVKKGFDEWVLA